MHDLEKKLPGLLVALALLPACAGNASFMGQAHNIGSVSHPDSSSPSSSGGESGDARGEDNGSDEPVFVNSIYLTCQWVDSEADANVRVGCQAMSGGGAPVALTDGQAASWGVSDPNGQQVLDAVVTPAPGPTISVSILLPGSVVPSATVTMILTGGPNASEKAVKLADALPGFGADGALISCLEQGELPEDCLLAAGINIPAAGGTGNPSTPANPQTPPPATPPSLPRTLYDSVAYYLGAAGNSCTTTCASLGGVDPATLNVVGSNGLACVNVLSALGIGQSVIDGDTGTEGVGCMVDTKDQAHPGHRVTSPAATADALAPGVRRVCACSL